MAAQQPKPHPQPALENERPLELAKNRESAKHTPHSRTVA
jgi:hypothetical protein